MPADTQLVVIEVEELLSDIRDAISRDFSGADSQSPVRYYPAALNAESSEDVSNAIFDEEQYLFENPDVALAVQRGDFQTGYDHWIRVGMHEGRKFPDSEVGRTEILEMISRLRALSRDVQARVSELGSVPPCPETLRGRLGVFLISVLRRATWWYTHSLRLVMQSVDKRSREEVTLLSALAAAVEQNRAAIVDLQRTSTEDSEAARGRAQQLEAQIRQNTSELKIMWGSQQVSERDIAAVSARVEQTFRQITRLGQDLQSVLQPVEKLQEACRSLDKRVEDLVLEQDHITAAIADLRSQLTQVRESKVRGEENSTTCLSNEMRAREELASKVEQIAGAVQSLHSHLADVSLYSHETRADVSVQQRRISIILEQIRSQPGETSSRSEEAPEAHDLDALYLSLENAFRGPRELIRLRLNVYLAYLQAGAAGTQDRPVLDLGCGRGEWLELLRDNGFVGRGVDLNERMVEFCRSLGLDIVLADSLVHLSSLPDSSLGAVTSFHMVEHLPFRSVITLLDESLRVLKPGGLLILETPNPDNLLVGSSTFHLDPTHVKPVPSQLLRFFIEARGFCASEVLNLHPYPDALKIPEEGNCTAKLMNQYLYGAQDYAIIARRP